jgi:antitoxin PrlF
MKQAYARLTSKNQATIPKEVRKALNLHPHDQIVYAIQEDNTVLLRKVSPIDIEYLTALKCTLGEWESEEDGEAYRNLDNKVRI